MIIKKKSVREKRREGIFWTWERQREQTKRSVKFRSEEKRKVKIIRRIRRKKRKKNKKRINKEFLKWWREISLFRYEIHIWGEVAYLNWVRPAIIFVPPVRRGNLLMTTAGLNEICPVAFYADRILNFLKAFFRRSSNACKNFTLMRLGERREFIRRWRRIVSWYRYHTASRFTIERVWWRDVVAIIEQRHQNEWWSTRGRKNLVPLLWRLRASELEIEEGENGFSSSSKTSSRYKSIIERLSFILVSDMKWMRPACWVWNKSLQTLKTRFLSWLMMNLFIEISLFAVFMCIRQE